MRKIYSLSCFCLLLLLSVSGFSQTEYKAEHKIGEIKLLGIDVHQYFDSQFYKDHDFNEVRNLVTGEKVSIDPTLSDYLRIETVKQN